jgi:hypothetical protein
MPFRTTGNVNEVYRRLTLYHGISKELASQRLHRIKSAAGRSDDDDVVFDLTGNIYELDPNEPQLLHWLGCLTAGGAAAPG